MSASDEVMIAYVYGDGVPPDFATLAACGFRIVCLDRTAPWFKESMLAEASQVGLTAVAFAMKYVIGQRSSRREVRMLEQHAS